MNLSNYMLIDISTGTVLTKDWDPELLDLIAGVVRSTGRVVDDIY